MNWKEYFEKNATAKGKGGDYRITFGADGIGKIHPLNRRGDTLDVRVTDQGIVIVENLQPQKANKEEKKDEKNHGNN